MIRPALPLLVAVGTACAAACVTATPRTDVAPPAAPDPAAQAAAPAPTRTPSGTRAPSEVRHAPDARAQPAAPPSAGAAATCYQVSRNQAYYSKTPELLCTEALGNQDYLVTLRTGLAGDREVARFSLRLLERVKCIDCNRDVFGLDNPSNSTFNALKISFDGKRDLVSGRESGTVSVGSTSFFYRRTQRRR